MKIIIPFVFAAAATGIVACSTSSDDQGKGPVLQSNPACSVPLGWWESAGLEPLFATTGAPKPTEDCQFHLWAWTAFVHFTQVDENGEPFFLSLPTPSQLGKGAASRPHRLVLKPRDLKRSAAGEMSHVDEIDQAGSRGVLVDQSGRAVYYSTHMDMGYFSFAQARYGKEAFNAANSKDKFPVGSTVLKASWRVVSPGENTAGMYTTTADIAKLVNNPTPGGNVLASGEYMPGVEVALVGMHVVSVLVDHPEFAWATFELGSNAPNLPKGMAPGSGDAVSDKSFTFYAADTAAKDCNVLANGVHVTVDEDTQICSPLTQVFREFEFGGASPDRAADIQQVNAEFHAQLPAQAANDPRLDAVFAAYHLVGTVWQKADTLQPGLSEMNKPAIGSVDLMNSTMETFVQGKGSSCFSCHNTAGGKGSDGTPYQAANFGISHVLLGPFFHD